jgi:hypothetical protein
MVIPHYDGGAIKLLINTEAPIVDQGEEASKLLSSSHPSF